VRVLAVLIALAVGTFSGLGLTWLASARGTGFGTVQIGAWTAWPKSGTAEIDPYARAAFSRSGELPLELADGIAFEATSDDRGNPLDGRCETRIAGRLPQARFWTITLYDSRNRLIDNAAERHGFNSSEVVWNSDGAVEIVLAPRARSGNWLPTGARERVIAVLRLYDAPVGLATRSDGTAELPTVSRVWCP
jgi:hypothetical protein